MALLERERELASLADALSAAADGRGRVVLIDAPAGLGKTSLLRATAQSAAEFGVTCLRARASDLERDFAYGCVRQLLEPTVSRGDRDRLFDGAAGLAEPLFAPAGVIASADGSYSVLHGLYWLLNNLAAETPIALIIDDLHWADAESLRLLAYLAPRLDGLQLTVLATLRAGEGDTANLARLAASPETTVLRLRPLSAAATAALCHEQLGDGVADEFVTACQAATGGNPFFLDALLHDAGERQFTVDAAGARLVGNVGPATVANAVLLRLLDAPAEATALVRAVAVLGGGASLAEAAALAGAAESAVARAADLLVTLAIFEAGERLDFVHPIVREAVYADIGARERAQSHARAARLLAARGASDERVAAQVAAAEPAADPDRVVLLRRVAADALARGAPAAAAAWLTRALAEPPPDADRGAVLLALGAAQLRLGHPDAAGHLEEAVRALPEDQRVPAVWLLATALTIRGDADRAVDALEAATESASPDDRLLLEAELAHVRQAGADRRAPAAGRLERYAALSGATAAERLVLASLAFERARASGSAAEASAHLDAALASDRLVAEQELDVSGTFYLLVLGAMATDDLDAAETSLELALAAATERASIPGIAFATVHRARLLLHRGDLDSAAADAQTALNLLTAHDISLGRALASSLLIRTALSAGDLDAAARALEDTGVADDIPVGLAFNDLLEARGRLRVATGRAADGLADLREFGRRDEAYGAAPAPASRWRSAAVPALVALGADDEARALAADDLDRAQRWGAPSGIGVAYQALALVDDAGRLDHLRAATSALAGSPARLEHARALADLGAALRRDNRRADARPVLGQAVELAVSCGAAALAERAELELLAAGGRGGRGGGGRTGDQLTTTERRVAELASAGHSNPQIAQALFVTRKTVETHLGHVYRKLGIAGRHELGAALSATVSATLSGTT